MNGVNEGHKVMCEPVRSPGSRDSGIAESSPSCRGDETNGDVSPVHHIMEEALHTLPNNINVFVQNAHTSRDIANSEKDVDSDFVGWVTSQSDVAMLGFDESVVPCPELVSKIACEQYEDGNQLQTASMLCDTELTHCGQNETISVSQANPMTLPSVHSGATDTDVTGIHGSRTEPCSVTSLSQTSGWNKSFVAACENGVVEPDMPCEYRPQETAESPPGDHLLEKGAVSAASSGADLVRGSDDENSQTVSYEYADGCSHLSDFDTETSDKAVVDGDKVEAPSQTSFFAVVTTGEQQKARLLDNILLDVNGNGQCLLCPKHSSADCKMCSDANYRESIGSFTTSSMAMLPLINGDDPKLSACPDSDLNFVQSQELQCSSDVLMPTQAMSGIEGFSCVGDSSNVRMVDLEHDLLASGSNAALPQLECFQFDDRDAWMNNEEDSTPPPAPMFYIGDNADSSMSSDYQDDVHGASVDSTQPTKNTDNEQRSTSFASEFYRFLKQRETKRITRSVSISHVRSKLKEKDRDYSPWIKRRHSCYESYNLRPKRRKPSQCECCMCDEPSEPAKPFHATAFVKNQLLVNSLRQKVVQLFDVLFPDLEYPQKFSPDSPAVEILMDKVMAIVQDRDPVSATQAPKKAVTDNDDCYIVLCKSPQQCLKQLRRKVCRMLQVLLPDLKFDGSFERQSAGAEQLLQEVIDSNLGQS